MEELSPDEARRLFLHAQGLLGAPDRRAGVPGLLRSLGVVQLDTISVVARSQELVAHARLGPLPRAAIDAAYWGGEAFEYWAHAASLLPLDDWPWFAFRRREHRRRERWGRRADPAAHDEVRALLAAGPITTAELGGARNSPEWFDRSPLKVAVEDLWDTGEVVCRERVAWRRVYDLAERAIPGALLAHDPDDRACHRELVARAGRLLGVGTVGDLADPYRLRRGEVAAVLEASGLVAVRVRGWLEPAWADPAALAALAAGRIRGRHRTVLLSPFDSLVWDRARTERIFGFVHRLEAYVPAPRRVHGYFVMPVLHGGRLIGRVDLKRAGRTLVARRASLERRGAGRVEAMADALVETATWVGCDGVAVEGPAPPGLGEALQAR